MNPGGVSEAVCTATRRNRTNMRAMSYLMECLHQHAVTQRAWHAVAPCLLRGSGWWWGCHPALQDPVQRPGGAVCALRLVTGDDCVASGWSQCDEQSRMNKSVWPALPPDPSGELKRGSLITIGIEAFQVGSSHVQSLLVLCGGF